MTPRDLDLDPASRRALEYDELLEWVASLASTEPGAERVRSSAIHAEHDDVARELDLVEEVRGFLASDGRLIPAGLPDAGSALEGLGIAGVRLDPKLLRDLASSSSVAAELRARLSHLDPSRSPHLTSIGSDFPDLSRESREVLEGTDPEGRILDEASSELAGIRRSKRRLSDRLERMLQGMLRDPDTRPVIQDDFITQRNGRFVIPVRTDAHRRIRGIVHASSSSGATRFVEPMESVELNNDLIRLAEEELEEQQRILAVWSESFRIRMPEVRLALHTLARLDEIQARGLFADSIGAVRPKLAIDGVLRLGEASHPLLDRHLRELGTRAVPLTLELDPPDQVLVVSGPNTGGKTVALKTIGLLTLMAQSGIPVPAVTVELPMFRQVRADIGDHQSIEADLSTFSAHIGSLVENLGAIRSPSLFLFDEIGTGTEPSEGGALAQSILERLLSGGITTVATTHLGSLKAWAFTEERASCAAMDFDTETFRPSYRIVMGAAGASAGLDIASRLGLDASIVDRARELMGPDTRRTEDYLGRLRQLMGDLEQEREDLRQERTSWDEQRAALESRLATEREREARRGSEALDRIVREFRELSRKELQAARDKRERSRLERDLARSRGRMELRRREYLEEVDPGGGDDPLTWPRPVDLARGTRVHVTSLGKTGVVLNVDGDNADIRLGEMTFKVSREQLRVPPSSTGASDGADPSPRKRRSAAPKAEMGTASRQELKLIGERADEALHKLDKCLDQAVLAGYDEVRIVHGHGTGRLRAAVREFLEGHPQVASHRSGDPAEGGQGATIAVLR